MATLKNTTIDDTGFVALPSGTGAQRPSASAGMLRYNSSRSEMEFKNEIATKNKPTFCLASVCKNEELCQHKFIDAR